MGFGNRLRTYRANNGRQYRRGDCFFTEDLPVKEGNYTYSLEVFPGYDDIYYQDTLRICKINVCQNLVHIILSPIYKSISEQDYPM